jgi:uncharacterized protein (TIGR03435 family)
MNPQSNPRFSLLFSLLGKPRLQPWPSHARRQEWGFSPWDPLLPWAVLRLSPILIALAGACIFCTVSRAQQAPAKLPQFEAVSIRPTDPDGVANYRFLPDGFNAENVPLGQLILEAYGLERQYQMIGLPKWAHTAHYAIVAKVGESDMPAMKTLTFSQRYKMIQPVLEDRFSLRCHWEKRSLPAYTLELSGKNAKPKDITSADNSKSVTVGEATVGAGAMMVTADGRVIARAVPIRTLVSELAGELETYVIDDTGLTGKYDFEIQLPRARGHSSSAANDDGQPDPNETNDLIQDGLSQIGLKLVPTKAELPVLVIDGLKPPSRN